MHVMLEYMDFSYMAIQSKKIFLFHTLSTAGCKIQTVMGPGMC